MPPLNWASFSGLLTALFSAVTVMVVLKANLKNSVHQTLAVFSGLVALWGMGLFLAFSTASHEAALLWFRTLNQVAMLIPITFVHFIYAFLGLTHQRKTFLFFGYGLSIAYCILVGIFSDQFVPDVNLTTKWFSFYPMAGPLYLPYFLGFSVLVGVGFYELFFARRNSSYQKRNQINYLLASLSVGFAGGSSTFPLVFGFEIYPFGIIGVTLLNVIFAYAIIRHQVLDISYALTQLISRLITHFLLITFTALALYASTSKADWTLTQFVLIALLVSVSSELYLVWGRAIRRISKKLILKESFDYQEMIAYSSDQLNQVTTQKQLIDCFHTLLSSINYRAVSFYVRAESRRTDGMSIYIDELNGNPAFEFNSPLISNFLRAPKTIRADEFDGLDKIFITSTVCVPLVMTNQLFGFAFAIKQSGGKTATASEMTVFDFLSKQVGMTMFRLAAQLEQLEMAEEKNQELRAQASTIAHEMRHPLFQVDHCLDKIRDKLPLPAHRAGEQALQQDEQRISYQTLNEVFEDIAQGKNSIARGAQVITATLAEASGQTPTADELVYLQASVTAQKAVDTYGYGPGEREKIQLVVQDDFFYKGIEANVLFIFFNLMKNALYYFEQKPSATLTITVERYRIVFRDTGIGIAPDRLQRLFEAFQSVGKVGGTGVGLPYCKRQMQAMSGDIDCSSELGHWTQFTLSFPSLPDQEVQDYERQTLAKARATLAGKRLLVVDDLPANRSKVVEHLQELDMSIGQAADGLQALAQLQASVETGQRYHCILLDLNMPLMDGYTAAQHIRNGKVAGYKNIPIIAYTAESAYLVQVKTEKLGMNRFVSKPVSKFELLQTLDEVLAQANQTTADPEHNVQLLPILIINDEEDLCEMLSESLELEGYQAQWVNSAEHALALLDTQQFSLILMDANMPGMNGVEATRRIRARSDAAKDTPVVMLTGQTDTALQTKAQEAGAQDFLGLPFKKERLRAVLARFARGV